MKNAFICSAFGVPGGSEFSGTEVFFGTQSHYYVNP